MIETSQDAPSDEGVRQDTLSVLHRLWETGEPIRVTINGSAEFLIQDTNSFERLIELVDRLETLEAIREGAADMEAGRTYTTEEVRTALRSGNELPR